MIIYYVQNKEEEKPNKLLKPNRSPRRLNARLDDTSLAKHSPSNAGSSTLQAGQAPAGQALFNYEKCIARGWLSAGGIARPLGR